MAARRCRSNPGRAGRVRWTACAAALAATMAASATARACFWSSKATESMGRAGAGLDGGWWAASGSGC